MEKVMAKTLADIEAYEKTPIQERLPFLNTYDLIKHGTAINPEATAISFLATAISFFLSGGRPSSAYTKRNSKPSAAWSVQRR